MISIGFLTRLSLIISLFPKKLSPCTLWTSLLCLQMCWWPWLEIPLPCVSSRFGKWNFLDCFAESRTVFIPKTTDTDDSGKIIRSPDVCTWRTNNFTLLSSVHLQPTMISIVVWLKDWKSGPRHLTVVRQVSFTLLCSHGSGTLCLAASGANSWKNLWTSRGRTYDTGCRAIFRSTQDLKPKQRIAWYSGANSQCSRAGNCDTVGGSAWDGFPKKSPAADCGADR